MGRSVNFSEDKSASCPQRYRGDVRGTVLLFSIRVKPYVLCAVLVIVAETGIVFCSSGLLNSVLQTTEFQGHGQILIISGQIWISKHDVSSIARIMHIVLLASAIHKKTLQNGKHPHLICIVKKFRPPSNGSESGGRQFHTPKNQIILEKWIEWDMDIKMR